MTTKSLRETWDLNLRVLQDVQREHPTLIALTVSSTLLRAILPYVTIWFSAKILAELADARDPHRLLVLVITALISFAVMQGLYTVLNSKKEAIGATQWLDVHKSTSYKKLSMDYQDLDDGDIQKQEQQIIQRSHFGGQGIYTARWELPRLLEAIIGMISAIALSITGFIAKVPGGSYAILNHPLFILILIMCLVLTVIGTSLCKTKSEAVLYGAIASEKGTFGNRVFGQFTNFTIYHPEYAMDIRLYGHQKMCKQVSHAYGIWAPNEEMGITALTKSGPLQVLGELISILSIIAIYAYICLKALGGAYGIGEVSQYVGAITALTANLVMLFSSVGVLYENTPFLVDYFHFLDLPNRMYQGSLTTEKRSDRKYEVEFRDVSFRYPGREEYALEHVSMKFRVGERLAIVGMNGSGKTTFIKLLCRLYDPTEGEILLNGIDIRKYNYKEYMDIFSVVFQDFQLTAYSLGQNVAASATYDAAKVQDCLTKAGFEERVSSLPNGLDTCLYRDFDEEGVMVSGGEAQKIAIARALHKDAPFIILDEPTAALDPIAEAEIYEKFDEIAGDKTAIYISHRLSSCRFCDEIAVFDGGHVVQKGSHEALLADASGKYHELWNAQAQYYR